MKFGRKMDSAGPIYFQTIVGYFKNSQGSVMLGTSCQILSRRHLAIFMRGQDQHLGAVSSMGIPETWGALQNLEDSGVSLIGTFHGGKTRWQVAAETKPNPSTCLGLKKCQADIR